MTWVHHVRHNIAKFEGSSSITSLLSERYPLRFCKYLNDLILYRRCILTLPIDLFKQKLEIWKHSRFFPISWLSSKNDILGDFGTKFLIGTLKFKSILNRVTNYHLLPLLCKKNWGFIAFPSLDMKDLLSPMIFT